MGIKSALAMLLREVDGARAELIGARARGIERRPRPAALGVEARQVVVEEVVRETADAASLVLRARDGAPFSFSPGQFMTVLVELDGERVRRSYSISSSADASQTVTLTVKRVVGGRVSGHLVARARVGMTLEVMGPSGAFTPAPVFMPPRRLVLLAGGSGITPMMSIVRTLLAREPTTQIGLLYANRSADAVIFDAALQQLAREHAPRLWVKHLWGEVFDAEAAERALGEGLASAGFDGAGVEYFLCGPEPMMRATRAVLMRRGVPDGSVREERFTLAARTIAPKSHAAPSPSRATVQLRVRREAGAPEASVQIACDVSILRAALAAGVELPHSCTEGVCGACRVRALQPEMVEMDSVNCLSAKEIRAGYVLTCVSRARGDLVLVVE